VRGQAPAFARLQVPSLGETAAEIHLPKRELGAGSGASWVGEAGRVEQDRTRLGASVRYVQGENK